MAAQEAAHEAAIAEERRLREEEKRRAQAEVQQQMAQMYSFIQGLSIQMGQQLPPMAYWLRLQLQQLLLCATSQPWYFHFNY